MYSLRQLFVVTVVWISGIFISSASSAWPVYNIPLKRSTPHFDDAIQERGASVYVSSLSPGSVLPADNLHGVLGQGYYIELAIGEPPQLINVLIDTGSSNFAVAASPHVSIETYFNISRSHTVETTSSEISVPYTQGSWTGYLGTDVVKLVSLPDISSFRTQIAFIMDSTEFFINNSNWQGILGLAYSKLARPNSGVETFFQSLTSQTHVADLFSLQLCGANESVLDDAVGTLTVGAVDRSQYISDLIYVPLRQEWYYEVVITDIHVGRSSLGLDCKEYNFEKTIVDSGTTNLRLPVRVYKSVIKFLKQHSDLPLDIVITDSFWSGRDLYCWRQGQSGWHRFPKLTLSLAVASNESMSLVVSPRNYLRRVCNAEQSRDGFIVRRDAECYRLSISPSDTGTVIGAVIMEGFYVVFDRQNKRLGFAQTACDHSSNDASYVEQPFFTPGDTSDCAYARADEQQSPSGIVAFVLLAICVVCLVLVAVVIFYHKLFTRCRRNDSEVENMLK